MATNISLRNKKHPANIRTIARFGIVDLKVVQLHCYQNQIINTLIILQFLSLKLKCGQQMLRAIFIRPTNFSYSVPVIIYQINDLNLDYYIKKKHIFKNRSSLYWDGSFNTKLSYFSIFSTKKIRLDFVYMRLFKKLFRRKFIKSTTRFFKPQYWLNLKPNYLLTQKSKNSRMGAGTGAFLRLTSILKPGNSIVKTHMYRLKTLRYIIKYFAYKLPGSYLVK